jgi:sec-independent protein translocase protein TatA
MQAMMASAPILPVFSGGEIVVIIAMVLFLFGSRRFPDFWRGFRQGIRLFRKASKDVQGGFDQLAGDAGKSLGGIHGKPAHEALTPDNQTIELYDPAVLRERKGVDGVAKKAAGNPFSFFRATVRKVLFRSVLIGMALAILVATAIHLVKNPESWHSVDIFWSCCALVSVTIIAGICWLLRLRTQKARRSGPGSPA